MGNKKTPLIQKLRNNGDYSGGTLYVFPSANEDIGLNLNSDVNGVALSHYALLNLPNLSAKDCLVNNDDLVDDNKVTSGAHALALSLQNYMMNMETLLINQENYNYQELKTVTEKVFWHWAKKIGIIKEDNFDCLDDYDKSVYCESGYDHSSYVSDDTVVKCFGSIDAGNKLSTEFGMFNETYINIPTSYGAGPVFFKCSEDKNFKYQYYSLTNKNKLEGRNDNYEYTSYLNYDYPFYDEISSQTKKARYVTNESAFEGIEIIKDFNTIENILKMKYDDDTISITSYDDVNVDVFDKLKVDHDFEFNAILLYYSVYDQNDQVKTAYATNLFGIIFLDAPKKVADAEADATGDFQFYIPRYHKSKSTEDRFGNSYSFRVNIKTMSVYDNVDAVIQDNTTMSSVAATDWSDAISQLNRAVDIMNTNVQTTAAIQDQYSKIISFYDNQEQKIEKLENLLNAYIKGDRTAVIDTSLVYSNTYQPSENNADNTIVFTVRDEDDTTLHSDDTTSASSNTDIFGAIYGEDGEESDTTDTTTIKKGTIHYKPPVMTVSKDGVNTTSLDTTGLYHNDNDGFVKIQDTTKQDINVWDDDLYKSENEDSVNAHTVLKEMFNSSTNLVVKVKYDEDKTIDNATHHDKVYNQFYLDSDSNIYEVNSATRTNFLKDSNENLNYTGLIPYMVAQLQSVTMNQNYVYDPNNGICDISQVDSMANALNFIINNMLGNNMKVVTASLEASRYLVCYGEEAEVNLMWTACDKNQLIKDVLINTSEFQIILNHVPQETYEVKMKDDGEGNTIYYGTIPTTISADKNFTLSASSSYTNSMGLSPAMAVKNITIKMVNKCYYWNAVDDDYIGCYGEGEKCENTISAKDVLVYFETSDDPVTLDKLNDDKDNFGKLSAFTDEDAQLLERNTDEESFYYFLIPIDKHEDYIRTFCGSNPDTAGSLFAKAQGTGTYQIKLKEGYVELQEFQKPVKYYLYRTEQTQGVDDFHIQLI